MPRTKWKRRMNAQLDRGQEIIESDKGEIELMLDRWVGIAYGSISPNGKPWLIAVGGSNNLNSVKRMVVQKWKELNDEKH